MSDPIGCEPAKRTSKRTVRSDGETLHRRSTYGCNVYVIGEAESKTMEQQEGEGEDERKQSEGAESNKAKTRLLVETEGRRISKFCFVFALFALAVD
jgi:hypothetical protein